MHILTTILLFIAGFIVLLLLVALVMRKTHYVKCEIVIDAPRQRIFDYLRFLKNQEAFNKYATAGTDRKVESNGTDGTVGYISSWSGDKDAGEGEKEIVSIVEGETVETEIRFVKPMKVSASIVMETKSLANNQTKVSWSNAGTLKYPFNMMIPMMEKHVKKDMYESLVKLKTIMEK